MAYGVILLPDQDISTRLTSYSAEIGAAATAYMILGSDAPPHITILHAECSEDAALRWWETVSQKLGRRMRAQLSGLIFEAIPAGDRYAPDGGVSVGVEVIRSSLLDGAHQAALAAAEEESAEPVGAVGESFRPHITLGVLQRFPTGPIPFRGDVVSGWVDGTPALGQLGPFGTFPRIIAHG